MQEFLVGKSQIRTACSVGSTVWLGTESGTLHVFCAMTYKQLCQGSIRANRFTCCSYFLLASAV